MVEERFGSDSGLISVVEEQAESLKILSYYCSFRDNNESEVYENKFMLRLIASYSVHIDSMMTFLSCVYKQYNLASLYFLEVNFIIFHDMYQLPLKCTNYICRINDYKTNVKSCEMVCQQKKIKTIL